MKHQIHTGSKLGRSAPQRNAMLKTMITQIIQHERIQTTQAKAKYVRGDLEKLITLAKHGLTASETRRRVSRCQLRTLRRWWTSSIGRTYSPRLRSVRRSPWLRASMLRVCILR